MLRPIQPLAAALVPLFLLACGPSGGAGTVVNDVTGEPLAGVIVTVQATDIRVTTDANGAFLFDPPPVGDVALVAALHGYFNGSARSVDLSSPIRLGPLPLDVDETRPLPAATDCGGCHPRQLDEWSGSAMRHGGTNTWLHDIFDGSGTENGDGGFVYTRDSVHAARSPGSECASCHQPLTWIAEEGALDPIDARTEAVDDGITCAICHQMSDIDITQPNAPGIFSGVVTLARPANEDYVVAFGVLGDVDFFEEGRMRAAYNPQLRSEICAACHQDANDPDGDHDFEEANSIISEPTYLEWANSAYADPESESYASCVDCHMRPTLETIACNITTIGYAREPGTLRSHRIAGTTAEYLDNAVTLSLTASESGTEIAVDVTIDNDQTGHHVPTGVTIRNMVLVVEATLADGTVLAHTGSQVIHDLGGVGDPTMGYYAGLPGKLYAKFNHGAAGPGTGITFFTDATGITADTRIPPLESDATSYTFTIPVGATGEVNVRARLIYRRSWRALLDAKQWTEDGHGAPLEDLAPPHFGHLMEESMQVVTLGAP